MYFVLSNKAEKGKNKGSKQIAEFNKTENKTMFTYFLKLKIFQKISHRPSKTILIQKSLL